MAAETQEILGWERFFTELGHLVQVSEHRIGGANRDFSLHIISRLRTASETLAAILGHLSSSVELRSFCQSVGELVEAVRGMVLEWEVYTERLDYQRESTAYRATTGHTGQRGRPQFHITRDQLVFLRSLSFTWTRIASLLGISRMTVYRRRREYGLLVEEGTAPSDIQLSVLLSRIRLDAPGLGQVLLLGRLRAMGYRVTRKRLREAVRAQDPLNTALRMPGGITARVKYSVAGPNSLWHIGE